VPPVPPIEPSPAAAPPVGTPAVVPPPPPPAVPEPARPNPYAPPLSAPPAYGRQPTVPQYSPNYGAVPKTNVLAIVSLVLSLASVLVGISAIGGIVCGHIALGQIKRTGESGRGLALAGVIVGYALVGFFFLLVLFFVVAVSLSSSTSSNF